MSKGLKGEYNHSVDSKGRMIVPSKLRERLGLSFVVTKGMDKCLYAYPSDEWELFENQLEKLPKTSKQAREFVRFFMGSAMDVEVDNQGRVMLANTLREFAGITKDVTIVGMGDHAEIWSKEKWDEQNSVEDIDFEEISKGFEDLGIMI
ncbi:MAG: division/cell wall cluster transcriptional repressor MraZ [Eubacteriales bacterium]|nr:division/cell wall cluster transcriptional repressor MraZ [Eubacteriales bacterium]